MPYITIQQLNALKSKVDNCLESNDQALFARTLAACESYIKSMFIVFLEKKFKISRLTAIYMISNNFLPHGSFRKKILLSIKHLLTYNVQFMSNGVEVRINI